MSRRHCIWQRYQFAAHPWWIYPCITFWKGGRKFFFFNKTEWIISNDFVTLNGFSPVRKKICFPSKTSCLKRLSCCRLMKKFPIEVLRLVQGVHWRKRGVVTLGNETAHNWRKMWLNICSSSDLPLVSVSLRSPMRLSCGKHNQAVVGTQFLICSGKWRTIW